MLDDKLGVFGEILDRLIAETSCHCNACGSLAGICPMMDDDGCVISGLKSDIAKWMERENA